MEYLITLNYNEGILFPLNKFPSEDPKVSLLIDSTKKIAEQHKINYDGATSREKGFFRTQHQLTKLDFRADNLENATAFIRDLFKKNRGKKLIDKFEISEID